MAFHDKTDYIFYATFLTVTVLILPVVSTENIDCKGKAFHCVNSTHFKICVDFGGGISKTVDDFLIPCPTNTVCRDINKFECEHQVTTTFASLRLSDVTNEQVEQSVTSAADKVDVTILFPELYAGSDKVEELRSDYISSTTQFSSLIVSDDTTNFTSITLDEKLNQVNLSSDYIQYDKKSDLSDSVTISYASELSLSLVTNNEKLSTITPKEKVNDTLINSLLHKSTIKNGGDSLAKTIQTLEDVTEDSTGLAESINRTGINVGNNNEYSNTNNPVTVITLATEIEGLSTPSEISENGTQYYAKIINVTNGINILTSPVVIFSNLSNEILTNHSSKNISNFDSTTESYSTDKEQITKSDEGTFLTSTYNNELLSTGDIQPFGIKRNFTSETTINLKNDVTNSVNSQLYTDNVNTLSTPSSNVLKTNFYTKNINYENTETLPSSLNDFSSTISVTETFKDTKEHLIIESSNIPKQSFENTKTSVIDTIGPYITDMTTISDEKYIVNLTESNSTTPYVGVLSNVSINSINKTNKSLTNDLSESNYSSNTTTTNYLIGLNRSKTEPPINFENYHVTNVQIDKYTDNTLLVNVNNTSTEISILRITNNTDFAATVSFLELNNTTNPTELHTVSAPDINAPLTDVTPLNIDVDLNLKTTLSYTSLSEYYSPTTTGIPKVYQNKDIVNSVVTSQTISVNTIKSGDDLFLAKAIETFEGVTEQSISLTESTNSTDVNINNNNEYSNTNNAVTKNKIVSTTTIPSVSSIQDAVTFKHKGLDFLNASSSPLIALMDTDSIYPFTMQSLNIFDKKYTKKTKLNVSNITNNNNVLYGNKNQVQSVNKSVIEIDLHTTPKNEEYNIFNSSLVNNTLSNFGLKTKTTVPILMQELTTSKLYENVDNVDIKTNDIITTTEATTTNINLNSLLIGHLESSKTYSVTQNILYKTDPYTYHKENVTKATSERNVNDLTHSNQKTLHTDNKLSSKPFYTLSNVSKVQDLNISTKETVFEPYSKFHLTSFPTKVTSLPFENILGLKTIDLSSKSEKVAQTTARETLLDSYSGNILYTKINYVNENPKRVATTISSANVILNNNNNVEDMMEGTSYDSSTRRIESIQSDLPNVKLSSDSKKSLSFENQSNSSFGLSQNLNVSSNDLKYNRSSFLISNVINNNKTLITILEADTNRNVFIKKDNYFLNKSLPHNTDNSKSNVKKQSKAISTVNNFSNESIRNTSYLNNHTLLTSQFTCLNRDRGKYSDKSNCNKFYICFGKFQPIIGMCPESTVFSEINKQCTKNLSHCIRNNQFKCSSSGRFIDVLSEQSYYICAKKLDGYVRFKLRCQNGYHLNKESIQCTSDLISIENISKTTSESQYASTDEKKSKEFSQSENYKKQFNCVKEGKFGHPDDCRKYIVCTKGSKSKFRRKIKKCDSDEVFNKEKRKCVDSDSYEC